MSKRLKSETPGIRPPRRDKRIWAARLARGYENKFFVAVDSEGMNYGKPFLGADWEWAKGKPHVLADYTDDDWLHAPDPSRPLSAAQIADLQRTVPMVPAEGVMCTRHRTFLWGALKSGDAAPDWLCQSGKRPLASVEILDWLVRLRGRHGPRAIFIAFAFGYDATQALADLPLSVMQRVQTSRGDQYTIWEGFVIRYLKGKFLTLARMLPGGMFRAIRHASPTSKQQFVLNCGPTMTIYDVWGFFQSSFLSVIRSTPDCVTAAQLAVIAAGKSQRVDFTTTPIAQIREYTHAELSALTTCMNMMRASLIGMDLRLTRWTGAGSIASAAFKLHKTIDGYGPVEAMLDAILPEQHAALHAYYGGRIELLKYGRHHGEIYSYDIVSAYPFAQSSLLSMRDGRWHVREYGPSGVGYIDDIVHWSAPSMCEVSWHCDTYPFGPFPWRTRQGAIYYPLEGRGIYCVDEILAVLRARTAGMPVKITYHTAWIFHHASDAAPLFAWLVDYYNQRAALTTAHKAGAAYDVREKVLKLGINSAYGKTAQKVGGRNGRPPSTANPWYAAVITARTRARLLDAMMAAPRDIIMVATDGIYSTVRLPLPLTAAKDLGGWEAKMLTGGIFVQSGVYFFGGTQVVKTRGIRLEGIRGGLDQEVLAAWRTGAADIEYAYTQYITLGVACRSPHWHRLAGHWARGKRKLSVWGGGSKRRAISEPCRPDRGLIPTLPATPSRDDITELSAPRRLDWLVDGAGLAQAGQEESAEVMTAKFG